MTKPILGDLQDGMLAYYLEQVKLSDTTVEARIAREPFDFRKNTGVTKRNDERAAPNGRNHAGLETKTR